MAVVHHQSPGAGDISAEVLAVAKEAFDGLYDFRVENLHQSRAGVRRFAVYLDKYPESRLKYFGAIAEAKCLFLERDIAAELVPEHVQRLLVVPADKEGGQPPFLALSVWRPWATRSPVLELPEGTGKVETYAYDTRSDLEYAIDLAKRDFPDADFSAISLDDYNKLP